MSKLDIAFDEIWVDKDEAAMQQFAEVTNGARTVPQILIDGSLIGGFTELAKLHKDDGLDKLLL